MNRHHTIEDYKKSFEKFKITKPLFWPRYDSPVAEDVLLCSLVRGQQPPSMTTIELGINILVGQGLLFRTDGGSLKADTQVHLDQIVARLDAPELTKSEIDLFQSLHPRELEQRYWADGGINEFSVRFNKAVREHPFGLIFQIPGRPASDAGVEAIELSAAEYKSTPANVIIQKLRSVPGYRKAVDKLIARGEI